MPATQRANLSSLFALLLGYGLMQMGNTFQGTLLSIRGGIEDFSTTQIGAVGSGFWAGIVIGSLRCGRWIPKIGHIRAFLALGAIASAVPLVHLLIIDPISWVIARGVTGFCFAGLFIVVESWLNGAATDETRGQILSVYGMTGLLAGVIGQLLLPAANAASFKPFCAIAIIIAFASVPIALTRAVAPAQSAGIVRVNLRLLYQQSPFGIVTALFCGLTTSAFFSLGPIYAQGLGLDTAGIAVFMACGTLGGFALTWPLGWLSDRIDRRFVIIGAAIIAAAIMLVLAIVVPNDAPHSIIFLCVAIIGGTIVPTYSVVIAHVNDAVEKGDFAAASGGLLIVQGVGAVIGPLIAGYAMYFLQRGLAFTIISAQILIVVFGIYRMRRRAVMPKKSKRAFAVEPPVPVGIALESKHPIDSAP
ncbi:MAG: MFS transporter [Verrucomicrobia bacterium]|nr:MFS transporter [Verrucomicrobiota bacterium]